MSYESVRCSAYVNSVSHTYEIRIVSKPPVTQSTAATLNAVDDTAMLDAAKSKGYLSSFVTATPRSKSMRIRLSSLPI